MCTRPTSIVHGEQRTNPWHGHIAIMRGVEDGFSIVRAAKNGFLT
jgi:apolipoprotein N-acyltransferase